MCRHADPPIVAQPVLSEVVDGGMSEVPDRRERHEGGVIRER
jgi:hypothetical protein